MMSSIMGVSSNTAKQMLAEFKRTRKSKIHCSYAICGYLHDNVSLESTPVTDQLNIEQLQFIMTIVSEEAFAKRKAEFARITSLHIYSVEPNGNVDLSNLWVAESSKFKALLSQETPESENYLKWGLILVFSTHS